MTTTTLTWASSGNCTKTGTAINNFLDDLDTLITSKSANAAFSWQKAGKVNTGTEQYLLLSRKDGSAGRIALIYYTSGGAPAAGNPTLFGVVPNADLLYVAFFPAGTGTTLSNLGSSSGTICGNDTGAVRVANGYGLGSFYGSNVVTYYFDSYDGIYLLMQDPASPSGYMVAAGALLEDTLTGTAVNAVYGSYYQAVNTLSSQGFGAFTYTVTQPGNPEACWRANYPSSSVTKQFFQAWTVNVWASSLPTVAGDVMADPTNSRYYYAPIGLISQTKGEGVVLKIRQVGFGSGSSSPFATYYTTGPSAQAMQMCNATAGQVNTPWLTNFKI